MIITKTKIAHKIYLHRKLKQNKSSFLKYELVTKTKSMNYINQLPSIIKNMQVLLKYLFSKINC